MAAPNEHQHDLVIYGATGFTGRLACEYLLEKYPSGVKWAMAGRSRERLTDLQKELGPRAAGVPLLVANALDADAVDALAASAKVVANFAGTPFMDKALPLVAACCKHGTHYVDITGEVILQRASYDKYHKEALKSRALIVHNTGYDSVPSDLGALLVANAMRERHGMGCSTIRLVGGEAKGGFSGGTLHSLAPIWFGAPSGGLELKDTPGFAEANALGAYPLEPEGGRRGPDTRHSPWPPVTYDEVVKQWVVPNIMASINAPVVRKSNALLGYRYGESCSYTEVMGFDSRAVACAVVGAMGMGLAVMNFPPTRWALFRWVLPEPGQGPSKEMRDTGFFKNKVYAVGERAAAGQASPPVVTAHICSGDGGDPGYKCTARMCVESALCLALERERCAAEGGVLTPATALGVTLVDRLVKSGMTLAVDS